MKISPKPQHRKRDRVPGDSSLRGIRCPRGDRRGMKTFAPKVSAALRSPCGARCSPAKRASRDDRRATIKNWPPRGARIDQKLRPARWSGTKHQITSRIRAPRDPRRKGIAARRLRRHTYPARRKPKNATTRGNPLPLWGLEQFQIPKIEKKVQFLQKKYWKLAKMVKIDQFLTKILVKNLKIF